jgi:pSer/pThr/pTyr-binding forkhead associated (FHA) protein
MCAIAAAALYTTLRRHGTTRQLAYAIIACVVSALLLLPAIVWYNLRFSTAQAALSFTEIAFVLMYIALWGLCVPLSATIAYCLFAQPRTSNTSVHIPLQQKHAQASPNAALPAPPRHQPGMLAPYVYSEDTPWGWLVYRAGRFQGQRLALKRAIVTLGRGEDNDIWLDDDLASRHHAELAWNQGHIYITDCDSLNGVLLAGQRIQGTAIIKQDSELEIGMHSFLFEKAAPPRMGQQNDDPLAHHIWHSAPNLTISETKLPATQPLDDNRRHITRTGNDWPAAPVTSGEISSQNIEREETMKLGEVPPFPTPPPRSTSGPVPLRLPSKQKKP